MADRFRVHHDIREHFAGTPQLVPISCNSHVVVTIVCKVVLNDVVLGLVELLAVVLGNMAAVYQ